MPSIPLQKLYLRLQNHIMTISYNWLSQYLEQAIPADELSHILTSVGLEVENMETYEFVKGSLSGLIIGKVMACEPHPNADKLKITKVNIGGEKLLNIVCGAPNVAEGQTAVVATVGTTIHPTHGEKFEIKHAKIRGEESEGMLCAEDEIGLGESHSGIIVLPDHLEAGTLASTYYSIPKADIIYEIGLTPNRMDAMSHLGVAKDVCAYLSNKTGNRVVSKVPTTNLEPATTPQNIKITIEDSVRCARYAGVSISNITVSESPSWLQQRLKSIGVNPINNIVDITNFVLHECGQPLHAFDLDKIEGQHIIIKTAENKANFISLDNKTQVLNEEDLMICNEKEPMCIAGIYGGLHSGVSSNTKNIFLESAWFKPDTIRKTSMRLNLRTDAAIRFEKGSDISNVPYALARAAQLICELANGTISSDMLDLYPTPFTPNTIVLKYEKIRNLAGKDYPTTQIKNILTQLCFSILDETEEGLTVQVPFAKPDITMQADVVEEIMRIDGLDNIPFTGKIAFSLPTNTKGFIPDVKKYFAQQLVGKGFYELFTNSITNAAYFGEEIPVVKMLNSLSSHLDVMRPSMLETGLEAIAHNLNRRNNQLAFFEFGKTYLMKPDGFLETNKLALYISGNAKSNSWAEKAKPATIYFVKGILESVFEKMQLSFDAEETFMHILFQNKKIGYIENVAMSKLKTFDIKQAVWFVELDWSTIQNFYENPKVHYKEIPKFPTVQRDLAMILDKQIQYKDVQIAVKQAKSKLLQSIQLFDVFESEKIGADKKSYAINLSFYNAEKTLTDVEVEDEIKKIILTLEQKTGAVIRSN